MWASEGPCAPSPSAPRPLPPDVRRLPAPACGRRGCANPTHLSRVCAAETPPPPYRFRERPRPPQPPQPPPPPPPSDDSVSSLAESGSPPAGDGTWCRLAYWEMNERVGVRLEVRSATVDVFGAGARGAGAGVCLQELVDGSRVGGGERRARAASARTRAKIGRGVTLSREADQVWLYNRGEQPVFVHSPSLDDADARSFLVCKVPKGHCLRVFDEKAPARRQPFPPGPPTGPVDLRSVRISFAKGWGPKYARQEVTACPCWLEVMLEPRAR